ncbi:MAG: autotransporter outer membrane beta-barrel domain-containing protein, partial [Luteolibacter sp.]
SAITKSSADDSTRVAVNIGGNGGEGAAGGAVIINNTGGIGTAKENSIGLFAQSIGGGGGNGRSVTNNSVIGATGNNFSVNIGGTGGKGATGGTVTVNNKITTDPNSGKIITVGNFSHGIAAMSIGGGGGNGSSVVNINRGALTSRKPSSANNVSFSLGGAGGEGGTGGLVNVLNEGSITTYGFKAHGILAQSIGGGGGNGGTSYSGDLAFSSKAAPASGKTGTFSIGGFGGDGNRSGDVTVNNSGSIEVFGERADGIFAQSVGGGGGDGGFAMSLSRNSLKNPKTDLAASLMTMALGGLGGTGADSGNVTVNHSGSIISHGKNSFGIFAQSVGGGGGNAAHSISSPAWTAADLAFVTLLGGGSTGTAGTVTINTTGSISMLGANSTAQLGQSVNGGGGNIDLFLDVSKHAVAIGDDGIELPDNSGDVDKVRAFVKSNIKLGTDTIDGAIGSAVDATHVGDLYTQGRSSIASLMQSIGGGGGNAEQEVVVDTTATVNLELALGGINSTNNAGGDVIITRNGDAATVGKQSQAVVVQSIGGGGGNLSVNVRQVAPATTASSSLAPLATPIVPAAPLITANALLGATGGGNSDGGDLTLNYSGDTQTTGARSLGLIVQSIGGGGGKLDLTGIDELNLAIGSSGSSGNGGNIALSNDGLVSTKGKFSNGLTIQSIGGGGGMALTDAEVVNISYNSNNTGNGGDITFDQTGKVVVLGKGSIGVLAQSLGGGGGAVDRIFADTAGGAGTSGEVSLTFHDDVLASGKEGTAVFAQSRAADGQGDITVDLAKDKTIYGGKDGEGLHLSGGNNNQFLNRGTIFTGDGLAGRAIIGEDGNDTIRNFGTFFGQFDLGTGANTFVNGRKAQFVPGEKLSLGAPGNTLVNNGIMKIGDMKLAQHTDMNGSFVQSGTGLTFAELDFGTGMLDQMFMTGSARLDGEINVSLLNPQLVKAGHFRKTLFSADMGVTDDGLKLTTAPSVVINYRILYPTGNDAILDYNVDFSPKAGGGMSRNLREVGDYFNRIQNAGSSKALADTVTKLLYDPTMDAYRESLSQLGPDFYGEHQAEMLRSTQRFEETMADGGEFRFMSQDKLIWFNYETDSTTHDSYGDYKRVEHNSSSGSIGIQKTFDNVWTTGVGMSLENNDSNGYDGRWKSDGNTMHLGAVAKRAFGATEFAGTVSYSWNETDSTRTGQVTDPFETDVSRDLETFGAMIRVSREIDAGDFYLKPTVDFGVVRLMAESASETGAGATDLVLKDSTEIHAWINPALRLGTIHTFGSGLKLHLHAEVGLQYYLGDENTEAVAGFAGAPAGVDPMGVPIDLGSYAHASVGVELINSDNLSLGLEYGKIIDEQYDIDHWNLRLNVPF